MAKYPLKSTSKGDIMRPDFFSIKTHGILYAGVLFLQEVIKSYRLQIKFKVLNASYKWLQRDFKCFECRLTGSDVKVTTFNLYKSICHTFAKIII